MHDIDGIVDSIVDSIVANLDNLSLGAPNRKINISDLGWSGGTQIWSMDMHDKDQFIRTANEAKKPYNSLAMNWIMDRPTHGRVGVMIASNIGRPGGACYTRRSFGGRKPEPAFHKMPDASTQEESVLTYIQSRATDRGELLNNLWVLSNEYAMKPGTGYNDRDFMVKRTPKQINKRQPEAEFNVRTSADPFDYKREFGFSLRVNSKGTLRKSSHEVYLSFVSAPNAKRPVMGTGPMHARVAKRDRDGNKSLDTVFRTYSEPAAKDLGLFSRMVYQALLASLIAMYKNDCGTIIMAAPGAGIYAGLWTD
jgi:hypothetical protein